MQHGAEKAAPYPSLVDFFTWANRQIDWSRMADHAEERSGRGKFYDVGGALTEAWQWASWLNLIDVKPLRVLDLGTGSGSFPLVCRYLGHDAIGLDLPNAGKHHSVLRESLGVEIIPFRMGPKKRLPPPPTRFDLITGFRIQFDLVQDRRWSADEWSFFLDDIRDNYLVPGGRLAVYPRLDDPERVAMFKRRGGRMFSDKRKLLIFDPLV